MKILIVAGGTGGHFYPGLAVAKELLKTGHEVRFIIRHGDMVQPLLQREGISSSAIFAGGFSRKFSLQNLLSIGKLGVGFLESALLLIRHRPHRLLAMGGYLSVPPALAARILGVPVFLHEQNVRPGLANRMLGRLAGCIAIGFKASEFYFHRTCLLTGNPIRPEFGQLPSKAEALRQWGLDPGMKTLLVFGGSLGAHRLNQLVVEALSTSFLASLRSQMQVIHLTGPMDALGVRESYGKLKIPAKVEPYLNDMPQAYAAADLVLCRAGASSVSYTHLTLPTIYSV